MHHVEFKVGEEVFIPRIYSHGEHTYAVILSVGRKYAKAVSRLQWNKKIIVNQYFKFKVRSHFDLLWNKIMYPNNNLEAVTAQAKSAAIVI